MKKKPTTKKPTTSWLPMLVVAVMLALVVGGYIWLNQPIRPPVGPGGPTVPTALSAQEAARMVARARAGVGYLENDQFQQAEAEFVELFKQIPTERFPVRNLAICRLLMFEKSAANPAVKKVSVDTASVEQSIDALLKAEPKSASAFWLAGRFNAKRAETAGDDAQRLEFAAQAIKHLEQATQLEPDNPIFWFQLYTAGRYHSDEAVVRKANDALAKAYRLKPDNLYVLTEQIQAQSAARDASVVETLTHAKNVLGPLSAAFERKVRANLSKLLDQAIQAAKDGQWPVVRRNVTALTAVRSDETCQGDMRRIETHPLEFAAGDLSPQFYEQYPLAREPEASIALKLERHELLHAAGAVTDARDARVVDFDLDDKPELLVLRATRLEVYRFDEQGEPTDLVTGVDVPPNYTHFLIADLDEDTVPKAADTAVSPTPRDAVSASADAAKPAASNNVPTNAPPSNALPPQSCFEADGDVVVYGPPGTLVFRNVLADDRKTRTLELVPQDTALESNVPVLGAVLFDMDHDGDADLMASTEKGMRLWSNRGNLLFEDSTAWSTLPPPELRFESLVAVDWDRDVDVDAVLAGPGAAQAGILESQRHGQFRWRAFEGEFAKLNPSRAVVPLEVDGNRSWDLACLSDRGMTILLTRTVPAATVVVSQEVSVAADSYEHMTYADIDNDGVPDVVAWGKSGVALLQGKSDGHFTKSPAFGPEWNAKVDTCHTADVDHDGDVDVVIISDGKLFLARNQGGNQNGFLALRCRGDSDNQSGRVNHWGIGSLVELKAGNMYQAQVVTSQVTHFGLGKVKQADVVRVLWTQGVPQAVILPQANQTVCEKMILKGSCPFVYTWDGEQFVFFTDLLWAAPLGLQFADGVIAPDRPWEYLLVPGERLQPKKDEFELRITEELWEAAYFDQVELLAVDHPANVEVFSNEKVGPPEIAEFKIHSVRNRRPLVSAKNHRGRDLSTALRQADGEMAQPFDRTFRQGLAEEHYLELNFGPLPKHERVTLFLTGWIRPTDTSLNVQISHHPTLRAPKPPSIWAPDPGGEWRETVPYMGFPGGKTKTIAVDVTRAFLGSDFRLRITTSAELYWDEAFYTVDDEPAKIKVTPMTLTDAELHYRGFSSLIPGPRTSPDRFDYRSVDPAPHWPPMRGNFTRFGNVKELLADADSRMVVMASGDEIIVRFAPPQADLPAGWKRDFILHNVGWDKDADLSTVFGQTVEPMPFLGMPRYPYLESEFPADTIHRDYLRDYQTRQSTAEFWRLLAP